jgi:hypothetical protein
VVWVLSVVVPGVVFVWADAGRVVRLKARTLAPAIFDKVEIFMVNVPRASELFIYQVY